MRIVLLLNLLLVVLLAWTSVRISELIFKKRELVTEIHKSNETEKTLRYNWSKLVIEQGIIINQAAIYKNAKSQMNLEIPEAREVNYQ